ncbi:hypothetical protein [Haloarchaeobius sp. HME9146]|uniref:hypothetical protein n=1 Tax=Haloarchaeobius sp. HME9146 TaxID=2978732 RepID=UPI0021C1B33C|nr:hypothetical protein [Haloarchaeobius sp. HME9146]MCT9098385.1 hypothetical protein [Haloarchaeobius sp. HME9146]
MTSKRTAWVELRNRKLPIAQSVAAGMVGGFVMGLLMQYSTGTMTTIAGLVGMDSLAAAWAVHLMISVVFGVVFGLMLTFTSAGRFLVSTLAMGLLGMTYGIVLWFLAAGFAMPAWLSAMNMVTDPAIPSLDVTGLTIHVLYGLVMAGTYMLVYTMNREEESSKLIGDV